MESKNTRPIFPWYKERLQTKYHKTQPNKTSLARRWSFVNLGLDGFTDCSSVSSRGVSPVIFQGTQNLNSIQKPRKCISKEHACFSKQMIQKQIRREYVTAVEDKLKQHPLTMYPHYKDHMTPEIFEKVVSILEPDMCVNSACALPAPTGDHEEEEDNCTEPSNQDVDRTKDSKIQVYCLGRFSSEEEKETWEHTAHVNMDS
uniref:protein FAM47E isoform X2 n=1 Tax=Scatophagus argus TaxID=75038 RepID=UPI001ED83376|nr:protein FAM47E isoform X2 [Scatophagus argus]